MLRSLNVLLKKIALRGVGPEVSGPNPAGGNLTGTPEVGTDPELTPAPARRGSDQAAFHMARGEWEEAIKAWNDTAEQVMRGSAENPDMRWLFAWSKLQVAICQWHLEAYAQSYLSLRLTAEFDRRILPLRETRLLRARLTGLVSKERSAAHLARDIAFFPDDYALLFEYTKCLIALREWEGAQDNVERLYAMAPSDPPLQKMIQKIRQRNDEPDL
jgi:hypothetical protein